MLRLSRSLVALATVGTLVLLCATPTLAQITIGSTTYSTIQAAVTAAGSGDTIMLSAGTYSGAGNGAVTVPTGKSITIKGAGVSSIVLGTSAAPVFTVASSATVTFQNMKITGGKQGISSDGTITVEEVEVVSNSNNSAGAGIYNNGRATIRRSLIADNTGGSHGGGIFTHSAMTLTVQNSTITGNTSGGFGGGIFANSNAQVTISSSTITNNEGRYGGGLFFNNSASNTRTLTNSIVGGNTATASQGPDIYDAFNVMTTGGHNHIQNTAQATFTPTTGDVTGTSPNLKALADNGGPTRTREPNTGSPVIDTGSTALAVDQRNAPRPFSGVDDKGAHEFGATAPGGNTPPTITDIADLTISEDGTTGPLGFTIGDAEDAASALTVSGASSNTALVDAGDISFGGSGASRTVTVTPNADANGTATITITVTDTGGLTASDPFLLTVTAVNDDPTAIALSNASTAENQTGTYTIGTFSTTDPDNPGDTFTYTFAASCTNSGVDNGSFTISGSALEATGPFDFETKDTYAICVTSTDSGASSVTEEFTITITDVNEAPTATDDAYTATESTTLTADDDDGSATGDANDDGVLANDTDPEGTVLTVTLVNGIAISNPIALACGDLTMSSDGTFTFDAGLSSCGTNPQTFTYTASDGVNTDGATVSITIVPANTAPVANDDSGTAIGPGVSGLLIDIIANDTDADGDPTIDKTTVEFGGLDVGDGTSCPSSSPCITAGGAGTFSYDASTGEISYDQFGGTQPYIDLFSYTVADDFGARSNAAEVRITISSVSAPPTAVDDAATTCEDEAVYVDVRANDTDDVDAGGSGSAPEGTIIIISDTNGTATVSLNGAGDADDTVLFTPDPDFNGTASFVYAIEDSNGNPSNEATVTITVEPQVDVTAGTASVVVGGSGTVSVDVDDLDEPLEDIYTFAMTFTFDKDVINVTGVSTAGTLSASCFSVLASADNTAGTVTVAGSCASPLSGSGTLFDLDITGVSFGTSPVAFASVLFNEGLDCTPGTTDGSVDATLLWGDVSLNGSVMSMDATFIMQRAAGFPTDATNTDPNPLLHASGDAKTNAEFIADVSGDGTISGVDALYVQQFAVSSRTCFPADGDGDLEFDIAEVGGGDIDPTCPTIASPVGAVQLASVQDGHALTLPLRLTGGENVRAADVLLTFDPADWIIEDVASDLPNDWRVLHHTQDGQMKLVLIGETPLQDGAFATLHLRRLHPDAVRPTMQAQLGERPMQPVEEAAETPTAFALEANFPNPFRTTTQVRYDLAEAASVHLVIYDALGRVVKTLVDQSQDAGRYTVAWDGTNDAGQVTAGGVYFYRLTAGTNTASNKLMRLR